MSEQQADTGQLGELATALQSMVQYAEVLRAGAAGFAYMLPAEWTGPAANQFIVAFETWAVTAEALRAQTELLQQHVAGTRTAYDTTSSGLDTEWSSVRSQMSA